VSGASGPAPAGNVPKGDLFAAQGPAGSPSVARVMRASIPSPSWSQFALGPLTVHAYALCILAGIFVAAGMGRHRWAARGGRPDDVDAVAVWAVPFGILGGRLYHVATDPELYFGRGRHPWEALAIWHGGLGIWGAVALGAAGAWIGARRAGVRLAPFADAIAPGIAVAQGIGRLGNWFNQELYGGPASLPWAVHITRPSDGGAPGYYHPAFLYELLWDLLVAALVIFADRRFRLGHGRAFAVYVAAYTVGRGGIELLRVDHANHLLGLRLNTWTSILVCAAALAYLWLTRTLPREDPALLRDPATTTEPEPEPEARAELPTVAAESRMTPSKEPGGGPATGS
jgi:prolipoprotein diacylglyceryl transferase